jgi:hypothetical protein
MKNQLKYIKPYGYRDEKRDKVFSGLGWKRWEKE